MENDNLMLAGTVLLIGHAVVFVVGFVIAIRSTNRSYFQLGQAMMFVGAFAPLVALGLQTAFYIF